MVREEFDVKIITEVKDCTHLNEVASVADIIQIGTKAIFHLVEKNLKWTFSCIEMNSISLHIRFRVASPMQRMGIRKKKGVFFYDKFC